MNNLNQVELNLEVLAKELEALLQQNYFQETFINNQTIFKNKLILIIN